MRQYTPTDLPELMAKAKPLPMLTPCSDYYSLIMCPSCLTVRPDSMIIHNGCKRLFCAQCINTIIESDERVPKCPLCRGEIHDLSSRTGFEIKFHSIGPYQQWMIDNLEFQCPDCLEKMKTTQALLHPNECQKSKRFKPPEYIHNWHDVEISRRETVSNPIIDTRKWGQRLIVCHHNGNQLLSKFVKAYKDVAYVKSKIAEEANCEVDTIRLYKFTHVELDDNETIDDVAISDGAVHLTSITDMVPFKDRTMGIFMQDPGPPPRVNKKLEWDD